jgi:hypothetical protein
MAGQHEAEPAEHPLLDHLTVDRGKALADFLGQLLVIGHQGAAAFSAEAATRSPIASHS